jgi:lipoyl(octanoyl) transferase
VSLKVQVDGPGDGPFNMLADAELLERGAPAARVYSWTGVWVSLGRSQDPHEALLDPHKTRHVRRPTGGSAVLHGHDVTVGIAAPRGLLLESGKGSRVVERLYRAITAPLVDALNASGVEAKLAADTSFVRGPAKVFDCFASVSPNDIVDPKTGHKVCGCALRSTRDGVLLQASIPNGHPLVDPRSVIREAASYFNPPWDASMFGAALADAMERLLSQRVELPQ